MAVDKNKKRTLIAIAVVFIAFSVIAFVVPFNKNGLFLISYLFAVVAIWVQIYVLKIAFNGTETAKSKFYGFPIAQVGIVYMIVQLVLSLVFIALSDVAPIWIAVVLYILLLAAAVLGFISTDAMRDEIVRQDVKLKTDVSCITTLRSIVYPLADQCENADIKKSLQNLADDFRYSDPVSSESLTDIESELENQVGNLQIAVLGEDTEDIITIINKIKVTLTERNRLCKLNKS